MLSEIIYVVNIHTFRNSKNIFLDSWYTELPVYCVDKITTFTIVPMTVSIEGASINIIIIMTLNKNQSHWNCLCVNFSWTFIPQFMGAACWASIQVVKCKMITINFYIEHLRDANDDITISVKTVQKMIHINSYPQTNSSWLNWSSHHCQIRKWWINQVISVNIKINWGSLQSSGN